MPIDELIKESNSNAWTDLCSVESSLEHAKFVEISPSRTLKIIPSLSQARRTIMQYVEESP